MRWFTHGVYRWRSGAATVWVCALSCPVLILYQLLTLYNPLHPISWLQDWLRSVLSLRSIMFGSLYILTLSLSSIIYSLTCTVILPVYKTRLSLIWTVLRPAHVIVVASYVLLGGGASYCLAELAGYHHLWSSHHSYPYCLNEYLFFHYLHGVSMGLRYGVGYYLHKDNLLVFPTIQQHKLFRLRGHMTSHMREGLLWTVKGLKYYYPLYFLLGYYPRNRFVVTLGLQLRDDIRLTSLSALLDIGLLSSLLVTGTMLHVGWSYSLRIFRTFQTEGIQFPVVATFAGQKSRKLTNCMSSKSCPLLQYLGFLDLQQLSLYSYPRRAQVFSLNYDGKPEEWEEVSRQCVAVIQDLVVRLGGTGKGGDTRTTSASPPTTSPLTSSPSTPTNLSNGGSPLSVKGWPELPSGVLAPPGVSRRMANTEKTRLWSYSPGAMGVPVTPIAPLKPQSTENDLAKLKKAANDVKSFLNGVKESLKRKPFFKYLLSELPEVSHQEKFADSTLQVWAITGISELAAASYTEDQYGVVQRTLPEILQALIALSQVLDKYVKAPLSNAPSTRNVRLALETNGKYAVRTAVQTALHNLAITFAKEIRSLQLSEDQITYWNQFMGTRQDHSQPYQ